MNAAGGDIHELRSLSEKVGQLEARRDAIVAENSRKHANLGTYEMTDPTDVLEKSAEEFATQVTVCPPLIILAFSFISFAIYFANSLYLFTPARRLHPRRCPPSSGCWRSPSESPATSAWRSPRSPTDARRSSAPSPRLVSFHFREGN